MSQTFKGTGVALVTPFNKDLSIDYESLKRIIDYIISGGIDFIVALGTTAETPTLIQAEKNDLVGYIVSTVAGRVPIMLGAGGNDTIKLVNSIRSTNFNGISGILSVTPYYNKPTQPGLIRHFEAVADASPVPVCLYNVPGRTGVNMTADTTLTLAQYSNIDSIKEASGNLAQINDILRKRPAGFSVLSGDDALTYPLMALGANGVISVVANAFPGLFSNMVHKLQSGEHTKALEIHNSLLDFTTLLFAEGSPGGVKAALEVMGLCSNCLRLPLYEVSKDIYHQIESSVRGLNH